MKKLNSYKIFENLQYAKKVLKDLHIEETNPEFIKLKELLKNNMGYMGKFTEWMFKDRESYQQLEEIFNALETIRLEKPITDFKKAEDLFDHIQSKGIDTKLNQVLKALPSKAREQVNQELKDLISLNIEHADLLIDFYSKKGGKYSKLGQSALIRDTRTFLENAMGEFNLETIKKSLEGLNVQIAYESPTCLMVSVGDYKTSCKIGSKHWCIATSQHMWDNYVDGTTKQYFVWDFTKNISDKEHMIGATIGLGNRIKNAHWSDDSRVNNPEAVFAELE